LPFKSWHATHFSARWQRLALACRCRPAIRHRSDQR
jgi:hypothetical protein